MKPTVLITATNDAVRRDVCDVLARFDYEAVIASDETEALGLLRDDRRIGVIVADVELGGLALAREARAIRPSLGVVYTSIAPHRVAESTKVSGAPILRKPYAAQQLVGVIGASAGGCSTTRSRPDLIAAVGSLPRVASRWRAEKRDVGR